LLTKKRCAEAPTPKNINDESIMANNPRSHNGGESAQPSNGNDKINIAISRRLVKTITYIGTHIIIPMGVYVLIPHLSLAYPKPPICAVPPSIQVPR
jgi:hypothetical protein